MEKYYYLTINFLIIIFPLILSFDKRVKYFRKWKYVLFSILVVSPVYLLWDYFATRFGHWSFNERYILGVKFLGLPLEECLFFVTVPFSCIFIYECLDFYVKKKKEFEITKKGLGKMSFLCLVLAVFFFPKYYTFTLLLFCSVLFLISVFSAINIFRSSLYWKFILISFIPFVGCNYFLTVFPIVKYSSDAILGPRLLTFPIEDILYSFSMLSFYILAYLAFRRIMAGGIKSTSSNN